MCLLYEIFWNHFWQYKNITTKCEVNHLNTIILILTNVPSLILDYIDVCGKHVRLTPNWLTPVWLEFKTSCTLLAVIFFVSLLAWVSKMSFTFKNTSKLENLFFFVLPYHNWHNEQCHHPRIPQGTWGVGLEEVDSFPPWWLSHD